MKYDKQVLSEIAGIENWEEFEEFVKRLYAKNKHSINVERNYRAKGASGRNREVDVRVTFGFNPHILSLGIECKYWSKKIDGDIIDVAAAKKDDLRLDKYAVITTVGFEAGAEIYAKSKGIDLFIIRPTVDDDFGYTGRVIKFKLRMQGSRPTDINVSCSIVAEQGHEEETADFVNSKIAVLSIPKDGETYDPDLELHRYSTRSFPNGMVSFAKLEPIGNLLALIVNHWEVQNKKFWSQEPCTELHKIQFKEPTALFLSRNTIAIINEINFRIQFLYLDSEFEIDRGKQYPLILENIIEKAVTPLIASYTDTSPDFTMCESGPKQQVDLSTKPEDVVGRDGVTITIQLKKPLSLTEHAPDSRLYELVAHENTMIWKAIE